MYNIDFKNFYHFPFDKYTLFKELLQAAVAKTNIYQKKVRYELCVIFTHFTLRSFHLSHMYLIRSNPKTKPGLQTFEVTKEKAFTLHFIERFLMVALGVIVQLQALLLSTFRVRLIASSVEGVRHTSLMFCLKDGFLVFNRSYWRYNVRCRYMTH